MTECPSVFIYLPCMVACFYFLTVVNGVTMNINALLLTRFHNVPTHYHQLSMKYQTYNMTFYIGTIIF